MKVTHSVKAEDASEHLLFFFFAIQYLFTFLLVKNYDYPLGNLANIYPFCLTQFQLSFFSVTFSQGVLINLITREDIPL